MKDIQIQTLSSIVTSNHRVVPVLEKYNLDFCCKGKRTLAEACAEKGIKIENITEELISFTNRANSPDIPFAEMDAEDLVTFVLVNHHFYVKKSMPVIAQHLQKIVAKHGKDFAFMQKVSDLFGILIEEMSLHMEEEEKVVFPAIVEVERLFKQGKSSKLLAGYIHLIEADHNVAGNVMHEIRRLTNNYAAPQNTCITFKITLEELKEFEEDLHKHVHIENNILFPKALQYDIAK